MSSDRLSDSQTPLPPPVGDPGPAPSFLPGRRAVLGGMAALAMPCRAMPAITVPEEWKRLPTEPYKGKQDDIHFCDPDHGWYGNGAGRLYRTLDGGESWTGIWDHPGTFIRSLGFIDPMRGFLGNVGVDYYPGVTDRNPLYRTVDGGRTWSPVVAEGIGNVAGICGIDILPVRRIYQGETRSDHVIHAAGRVGGPTCLMRSTDGGNSWIVRDMRDVAGMILDVKFLTPSMGFVAASAPDPEGEGEALILRTMDGARSWTPVYRSGRRKENVWKMSWPTPLIGYGTVQSYDEGNLSRVFVRTDDGGSTWREGPLVHMAGAQEFGVGFASAGRGWIGCREAVYETRDGGKSWTPVHAGRLVNKIRIVRGPRSTRVFAIGEEVHRLDLG